MAQAMANNMAGGMTGANIAAANTSVGNYFMVTDILHTQPMNPLVSGSSGTATQDMKNYGMAIAAMSQSAKDMGMTSSSSMVTAMMNDASDGVMNGLMGSTPIMMGGMMAGSSMMTTTAGTSGLASEMATFITSTMNKSGVTATDMQTLMNHLTSSATGTIQSGGGTMMNGMVSGSVFNGSMSNATVMAYSMTGGAMGAQLASGTTNSMGSFSLSLGAYSGPVMLKMSGGSYTNLATGTTMTMLTGDVMTAVIPTISSGTTITGIQMTPLTSMAQARAQAMTGGMTDANIAAANTAVGNYFMVTDILHTTPMNAAVLGSGGTATTDMKNYGIAIAAMSQYAQTHQHDRSRSADHGHDERRIGRHHERHDGRHVYHHGRHGWRHDGRWRHHDAIHGWYERAGDCDDDVHGVSNRTNQVFQPRICRPSSIRWLRQTERFNRTVLA